MLQATDDGTVRVATQPQNVPNDPLSAMDFGSAFGNVVAQPPVVAVELPTASASDSQRVNSKGYPLRPDSIVCKSWMAHGRCDFGHKCRYHHPEPEAKVANEENVDLDAGSDPGDCPSPVRLPPICIWDLKATAPSPDKIKVAGATRRKILKWLIDTGCGHDLLSELTRQQLRAALCAIEPLKFETAGGLVTTGCGAHVWIPE